MSVILYCFALQNVNGGCSFERTDNENVDGMVGDLDELRRHLENKKSRLLEKERQLRQEHESVSTKYMNILTISDMID